MGKRLGNLSIGTKFMMVIFAIVITSTFFFVGWGNHQLRKQSLKQARETAFAASELVRASLTTLMSADAMDERGKFFKEMGKLEGLDEVRVFRSEAVDADYPGKNKNEEPRDEQERQVLTTGEPFYQMGGQQERSSHYRVIIPYAAEKSCISSCHESARVGEVLGGITLKVSLAEVEKDIAYQQRMLIGIGLVGLALILLAFHFCVRNLVVKPIDQVVERIKDIARGEGDLTQRIKAKAEDEIGMLVKWFNAFLDQLHDIIARVAHTANQVAASSSDLLAIADKTASEAKEQAVQTDQAAAAMQEISNAIVDVTKNTVQVSESAEETGKTAGRGEHIVSQAMVGMSRIAEVVNDSAHIIRALGSRSDQIGEIVAVIDNIADQTNLLALNAAIEAARAGEQGRGFAIVADEVRKLAERTTGATKEIAEMIKSIQEEIRKAVASMEMGTHEVKEGVTLVQQAEMVLKEISLMVQEVMGTIQRIAAAAEEQSAMSEEMLANLEAVAKVAQDTSSRSSQACQSSQGLNSLALGLQGLVSQFKLHSNGDREAQSTDLVPVGFRRRGGGGELDVVVHGSERKNTRLLA